MCSVCGEPGLMFRVLGFDLEQSGHAHTCCDGVLRGSACVMVIPIPVPKFSNDVPRILVLSGGCS